MCRTAGRRHGVKARGAGSTAQPAKSRGLSPRSNGVTGQPRLTICSTGWLHAATAAAATVEQIATVTTAAVTTAAAAAAAAARGVHRCYPALPPLLLIVPIMLMWMPTLSFCDHCSYETCGNLDSYAAEKHYSSLRGRHIRVSYPGDSSTGYTILTNDDGSRDGSVVQFMRDIAADAGFTWEVHEVSPASRARYSSSYSACTHEVALNRTDVSTSFDYKRAVSIRATLAKVSIYR
jgi:hypothetical protein